MPELYRKSKISTCGENDEYCSEECQFMIWDNHVYRCAADCGHSSLQRYYKEGEYLRTKECEKECFVE